ncbi:MAG: Aldehyde dehydrogenase, partial [uncultured Solirubrobacteraceae bacterium]
GDDHDDPPLHRRGVGGGTARRGCRGDQPGDRRVARPRRPGRPRGGGTGRRSGARGVRRLEHDVGLRARACPAPDRRRLRGAPRRAGARLDARPGQAAAHRGLRGGRRAHRHVARLGRGRRAPRGLHPAEPVGRAPRAGDAPAEGTGRRGHALELAVHDARRAPGTGAGVRQHGGLEPRAEHRGLLRGTRRVRRRGRPAARRVQLRAGARAGGGRRDRLPSGHRGGRLHRLDRHRAPHRRPRGGQGAAARDGRQRTAGGPRGRRPRGGRAGGGGRLLHGRRAELHRRGAAAGPRGRARRLRRAARRAGGARGAARRSAARGHRHGAAQQRGRRGQDGRARRRRREARRVGPRRRSARRGVSHRSLLARDGARRGARRRRGRQRGDLRPDRTDRLDRLARGGDRAHQRIPVRAAGRDIHRRPAPGAALRGRGPRRAGEHQRDDQLLGEPPALRRSRRQRLGQRARRRTPFLRGAHRAADDRDRPFPI